RRRHTRCLSDWSSDVCSSDLVVAPDVGSAKMARGFAKRLDASLAIIDKRRPSANIAEVVNVVGEVEGKDVLLPDDMIDTAGTIEIGRASCRERGEKSGAEEGR